MNNQQAQDAYARAHAQCCQTLARIAETLENCDAPSERTNWGNVGDLNAVLANLQRATEGLGIEEDKE